MTKYKHIIAIAIIWLFYISGIIGITLGYADWFIPKTPLTLLVSFILLIFMSSINQFAKYLTILVFFAFGFFVEWVGVTYGFLFGEYVYGSTLGFKIDGVPILMGVNWAMLIMVSGTIVSKLPVNFIFKSAAGATLMVFLDFFIEPCAPNLDFWHWDLGGPPLINYISWFIISFLMHLFYHRYIKTGNLSISTNLYIAQLVFFSFIYAH